MKLRRSLTMFNREALNIMRTRLMASSFDSPPSDLILPKTLMVKRKSELDMAPPTSLCLEVLKKVRLGNV